MGEYYEKDENKWKNDAKNAVAAIQNLGPAYAGRFRVSLIELWILANEQGAGVTASYEQSVDRVSSAKEGQSAQRSIGQDTQEGSQARVFATTPCSPI